MYRQQPTGYWAFHPTHLPIGDLDPRAFARTLSAADQAVGRLDGLSVLAPNIELFLGSYVRKEAVLSSRIEGTQATLGAFEKARVVQEVTGRRRGRVYAYTRLMELLNA